MEKPFLKIPAILLALFVILTGFGAGLFLLKKGARDNSAPTNSVSTAESTAAGAAEDEVVTVKRERDASKLEYRSMEDGKVVKISLSQVALRDADGKDHITRLDPPATIETLGKRLAELEAPKGVRPVAYEDGEENTSSGPRMVTSDILAKIPQEQAELLAKKHGLVIKDRPSYAPEYVVFSAAQPLEALEKIEGIRDENFVETADVLLTVNVVKRDLPNDTFITKQWHLKKSGVAVAGSDMNVEDAWKYNATGGVKGTGINIAIVDDGLQTNHPDLTTNVDTANDYDWNGVDFDPSPGAGDNHGTACAGVAAARGNNGMGVSGVAPEAKLIGLRLIAGNFTDQDTANALSHKPALVHISSNSWGPSDDGSTLDAPGTLAKASLKSAAETGRGGKGTIFVWAGGNGGGNSDNSNYDGYANSIYTIAVGATSSSALRSAYSEPGANLVISAPSSGGSLSIVTTDNTGSAGYSNSSSSLGADYTDTFGGTSSACPAVAGAIALMLEKNPLLGWRDVQEILIRTANKIKPTDTDWITNGAGFNFNHNFGAGLIDATAAVNMAATWTNLDTQISTSSNQNNINVTIPNNSATGVSRTFDLNASNIRVEQVTVFVDITHARRGELAMTLTSPNGTESRLSEVHSDTGSNYASWTFSTVRNWGENSRGTWTLKVADRGTGNNTAGVLKSARITVYGASGAAVNPAPQVTITSPVNGAQISPGTALTVTATAVDFDIDSNPSTVNNVQLYANGALVAIDVTAPYSFNYTPPLGNVTLVAKATDIEGKVGESVPVSIFVANRAPTVQGFAVNYGAQAFADEQVSVTSVTTSDPENDPVTVSYQWRFTTDLENYTDQPGATSANLPISPDNAGKVWVCEIRASDASNTSAPSVTAPVNILLRPNPSIAPGSAFSYTSGLVLNGSEKVINRPAIIHEFSQGSQGTQSEWVEILVMQDSDLNSWRLSDPDGNFLVFLDDPVWEAIPAGTLIVIYNGGSQKDPLLPSDSYDASSGKMVIASTNRKYFSATGVNWPDFGNTGDSIFLLDGEPSILHSIAYGNSTATSPNVGNVPVYQATYFTGQEDLDANEGSKWQSTAATVTRSVVGSESAARALLTIGSYTQNFDTTPGPSGSGYPEGWRCFRQPTTTTTSTIEDADMAAGSIETFQAGNYNFGSSIGLLGNTINGVSTFDPSYISFTLDHTKRLTDLKISYDIIKVREQGRSMEFNLQYATSSPANTSTVWSDVPGGGHISGNSISGTVTTLSNVSLPAAFNNREGPIHLRWFYRTVPGSPTGFRDTLAIDNVTITSSQAGSIFLSLSFQPDTVLESAGFASSVGRVTAHTPVTSDTTIQLVSANPGLVTVPTSVIMRAGQSVVTFPIGVTDNSVIDGTRSVSITASATGLVGDTQTFKVADDEGTPPGVTPAAPNGGVNDIFVAQLRSGILRNPAVFSLAPGSVLPAGLLLSPSTGVISGTVAANAAEGSYPITILLTNILGDFVSQSFVLNVGTGPPPFAQWIAGFMVADSSTGGDPDFDLFPSFLEYAMGTRPDLVENPSPVIFERNGAEISITYQEAKNLNGVVIVAEWSPSLLNGTWSTVGITTGEVADNGATRTLRATLAVDPLQPKRFMRIRASEVTPP
ncbi:MAG: S8 family serine peptidase [Luteolibacter sp.]